MPGDLARANWDRDEVHKVFDALEFRVLRDRLYATVEAAEPEADEGFDVDRAGAGERRAGRLAGRARARRRAHSACTSRATGPAAPATSSASRSPAVRGEGAWFEPTRPRRRPTSRRSPPGWPTPTRPKVLHDAKGPLLAFAARGWELAGVTSDTALAAYLAMPDQRSYDLADLALRYLHRELRAEDDGGGQLTFDGAGRGRRPRRPTSSGRARSSTSPSGWTPSSRPRRRPGCCARSSCRSSTCSPRWSAPASPSTRTTSRRWSRSSLAR